MQERDIHHEKERYEKEVERIKSLEDNSELILEWLRQKKLKNKSQTSTLERQLLIIKQRGGKQTNTFKSCVQLLLICFYIFYNAKHKTAESIS
jgi:hypothetical protein